MKHSNNSSCSYSNSSKGN